MYTDMQDGHNQNHVCMYPAAARGHSAEPIDRQARSFAHVFASKSAGNTLKLFQQLIFERVGRRVLFVWMHK